MVDYNNVVYDKYYQLHIDEIAEFTPKTYENLRELYPMIDPILPPPINHTPPETKDEGTPWIMEQNYVKRDRVKWSIQIKKSCFNRPMIQINTNKGEFRVVLFSSLFRPIMIDWRPWKKSL